MPDSATSGASWPKRNRLLRRADFRATYELGMRRSSRHFTVFARTRASGQGTDGPRFGITASKKLGPAVLRNRIRRRTRELLRHLPLASGCGGDFVLNPRPAVAEADFKELSRELGEQIERLCRSLAAQRS